jgi:hypothetical protein
LPVAFCSNGWPCTPQSCTLLAMQTPSLTWNKSSLCQNGECVEIATYDDMVVMRSSALPDLGYVYFSPEEFGAFLGAVKAGEFNLVR